MRRGHILVLFWLMLVPPALAGGNVFTDEERSLEAMFEAGVMNMAKMHRSFGPAQASLSFTGSFNAAVWSATLNGNFNGLPLNVSFVGTYSNLTETGNYLCNGFYGTSEYEGSGTWSFIDIDADSEGMFWDSEATIARNPTLLLPDDKKPDQHFTEAKIWSRHMIDADHIHIIDQGKYKDTENGVIVGNEKTQDSKWVKTIGGSGSGTAVCSIQLPDVGIQLNGTANFNNGTMATVISSSPAIPAVSQWGIAVIALLILTCGTIAFRRSAAWAESRSVRR